MAPTTNHVLDFEIHILPKQGDRYPVQVKLGDGGDFAGRLSARDLLPWVSTGDPVHDGQRLFNIFFADATLRTAWDAAWGRTGQCRVRLWIDTAAAELHALPWEQLHDGDVWLAANGGTPFSRYLTSEVRWGGPVGERPIRVLAVGSNPNDLAKYNLASMDVRRERELLEQALAKLPSERVDLTFMEPPITLSRLERALRAGYHVLHVVGHGTFSQRRQQAALCLQDDAGNTRIVTDERISQILKTVRPSPSDLSGRVSERHTVHGGCVCRVRAEADRSGYPCRGGDAGHRQHPDGTTDDADLLRGIDGAWGGGPGAERGAQ